MKKSPLTLKRIRSFGVKLRMALRRRIAVPNSEDFGTRTLSGMCAIASTALVDLLHQKGHKADLILGQYDRESHCWVEWSGYYIDLTFTQFQPKADACFIVRTAEAEGFQLHAKGAEARRRVAAWAIEHRPSTYADILENIILDVLAMK